MVEVFVDTSVWYPAFDAGHQDHAVVAGAIHEVVASGARLVTSNIVAMETHALLLHRVNRDIALRSARTLYEPPTLVVNSTLELERSAFANWLSRFADQDFSFTDGVSFAIMKSRGISRALALDVHFSVAGFEMLPATSPRRRKRR